MGPSKAHIIRSELLFLEALLSQHKTICASQQRVINALPPSLSLPGSFSGIERFQQLWISQSSLDQL